MIMLCRVARGLATLVGVLCWASAVEATQREYVSLGEDHCKGYDFYTRWCQPGENCGDSTGNVTWPSTNTSACQAKCDEEAGCVAMAFSGSSQHCVTYYGACEPSGDGENWEWQYYIALEPTLEPAQCSVGNLLCPITEGQNYTVLGSESSGPPCTVQPGAASNFLSFATSECNTTTIKEASKETYYATLIPVNNDPIDFVGAGNVVLECRCEVITHASFRAPSSGQTLRETEEMGATLHCTSALSAFIYVVAGCALLMVAA